MRNYGFEYLVEKVQVLNEMAPKSKFWNTNFPIFMEFYLGVQNEMARHPKAPSGTTLGHRRIEYISRMLFDFLSKDELAAIGINKSKGFESNVYNLAIKELSPEERIERGTRKKREYTPGYAEFAGTWADATAKQQDYMLSLMVGAYEEKALSKKFTNKVMDKANIDAYFNNHLFKDFSSNFASGMKTRKEELINTGKKESDDKMELGDFYEIQNKAKAIIQKLRKSKKLPKGLRTSIYHADVGNIKEKSAKFDKELYPLIVMQTTLEQFLELKKEIIQDIRNGEQITPEEERLFKFDRATLSNLLDIVNNRINEKKPLSLEKVYSNIIEKMTGISDQVRVEYDGLYEDLQSDSADALKDRYDTVFDMLDDELLNSLEQEGIINSEDRETLKKWASISGNLQKNIQTRGEKIVLKNIERGEKAKKYEDQGKKWEAQKAKKSIKSPKNSSDDLPSDPVELQAKIEELMLSDDPDFDEIDRISKKLKKVGGLNESSVMGYMAEQVHKDSFTDNRGKFVDRGFKKPKNYAHWLWLNEQ